MRRAAYRKNIDTTRARVYEQSIQRRFGLSLGDYENMLDEQEGVCAICGAAEAGRNKDGSPRRLHIDHDHSSGQVRSLLCSGCNGGLAGFEEDKLRMGKAINYLNCPSRALRLT